MLNIEYWKDELKKIGEGGCIVAVENNIPKPCDEVSCLNCDFYLKGKQVDAPARCERFYDWLLEEYKEPEIDWDNDIDWKKVPVDTPVLVSDNLKRFVKNYFALYLPNSEFIYATVQIEPDQTDPYAYDIQFFPADEVIQHGIINLKSTD